MDDDCGMGHHKNRVDDQVYLPVRNVMPESGQKCCFFFVFFFFCLFVVFLRPYFFPFCCF